jgi:hypothetical protein
MANYPSPDIGIEFPRNEYWRRLMASQRPSGHEPAGEDRRRKDSTKKVLTRNDLTERDLEDNIIQGMLRDNVPLTRERYLLRDWLGSPPEPWTAELEAHMPPCFREW